VKSEKTVGSRKTVSGKWWVVGKIEAVQCPTSKNGNEFVEFVGFVEFIEFIEFVG